MNDDNVVQSKSRWLFDDSVFIVDGKGYGVTDRGTTFCIGSEADILAYVKGEEVEAGIAGNMVRAGCTRYLGNLEGTVENTPRRRLAVSKGQQKRQAVRSRGLTRISTRSKNSSRSAA